MEGRVEGTHRMITPAVGRTIAPARIISLKELTLPLNLLVQLSSARKEGVHVVTKLMFILMSDFSRATTLGFGLPAFTGWIGRRHENRKYTSPSRWICKQKYNELVQRETFLYTWGARGS